MTFVFLSHLGINFILTQQMDKQRQKQGVTTLQCFCLIHYAKCLKLGNSKLDECRPIKIYYVPNYWHSAEVCNFEIIDFLTTLNYSITQHYPVLFTPIP